MKATDEYLTPRTLAEDLQTSLEIQTQTLD